MTGGTTTMGTMAMAAMATADSQSGIAGRPEGCETTPSVSPDGVVSCHGHQHVQRFQ